MGFLDNTETQSQTQKRKRRRSDQFLELLLDTELNVTSSEEMIFRTETSVVKFIGSYARGLAAVPGKEG